MLCVLRVSGVDYTHECWSLTHGAFTVIRPTYDPDDFFVQVRRAVRMPGDEAYRSAIKGEVRSTGNGVGVVNWASELTIEIVEPRRIPF
jgi:hypothetical protein